MIYWSCNVEVYVLEGRAYVAEIEEIDDDRPVRDE